MSEEEQKVIEELKEEINKPVEVPEDRFDTFILFNIESAKIILNLIDRLQKENEELKHLSGIDIYKLGQKTQRDKTNFEIDRLQKELEQEKEKNKELNLENQALYESINCNDDNMLARRYDRLQKENEELNFKLKEKICIETHRQIQENFVSKDKIKEEIEEYKRSCFITINNYDTCGNCDKKCAKGYKIMALEDLLKENK